LIAVFLFGVLLFTPPFIGIFNNPQLIFEFNLYFYLFTAWTLLVLLIAVVIESSDANETPVGAPDSQTGSIDMANEKPEP
jgi:hypothetical protein